MIQIVFRLPSKYNAGRQQPEWEKKYNLNILSEWGLNFVYSKSIITISIKLKTY